MHGGALKLLSHKALLKKRNRYIKDNKIHLIVIIKLQSSNNNLDESMESSIKIEEPQFDDVFIAITTDNDFDDRITLQTADGLKLKALKTIITKKSPVFAAMFENDMVEKPRGVVEIIDFRRKVIAELLRCMYFGKVHSIKDFDMELYSAAKVYQIEGLGDICLMSIEARIDPSNVFKIVEFADVHDELELFDNCSEIICR